MSDVTPDIEAEDSLEDFDAYWESIGRKGKRTRIMGEVVTLPPSLPLQFELEAQKLRRSKNERDMRKLVGILFGDDALDKWTKAGLDLHQLMVLLAWAPRVISGQRITLAEVDAEVRAATEQKVNPT